MSKGLRKAAVDPRQLVLLFGDVAEKPVAAIDEKPCTKCKAVKPLEAFRRDGNKRDGRRSWCAACDDKHKATPQYREAMRRRKERIEAMPANAAEKPCKECGVPKPLGAFYVDRWQNDGHRSICIDCDKARKRTDEVRVQSRKYNSSGKGQVAQRRYIESGKKVANLDQDLLAERIFRYVESGKYREWIRACDQKRRSIRRSLPATLTATEWLATLEFFGNRCVYCGDEGPLEQDHFIPVTRRGPYTQANIVPACSSCNRSKNNRLPEQWCDPEIYAKIKAYLDQFA